MDRKHEKTLATLGDEQLSAVSGGTGYCRPKPPHCSYPSPYPSSITKNVTVDQSNVGLNFVGGCGSAANGQSNDASVSL